MFIIVSIAKNISNKFQIAVALIIPPVKIDNIVINLSTLIAILFFVKNRKQLSP